MAPIVAPIMFGIGMALGWFLKPEKTFKDGDPHPSGDGRKWSKFYGDWSSIGVKP